MKDVPTQRYPAVQIQTADRDMQLHGELPCLFFCEDGRSATIVFFPSLFKPKRLLPAFLFYVATIAEDSFLGAKLRAAPFTIHYVFKKSANARRYETANWAPFRMSQDEAKTYLIQLSESMLTGKDYDLLPFDLIGKCLAPNGRLLRNVDFAQTLRDELTYAEDSPDYYASPIPESQLLANPSVPDDAEVKIRARLSPFFNFLPDDTDE